MGFREILEKRAGKEEEQGRVQSPASICMERGGYGSRNAKAAPIEGEIASEHEFFV